MILKPQDLLVLLKLVTLGGARWSYNGLATDLGMSPSEVHAAMKRAVAARLAVSKGDVVAPVLTALTEFLAHGGQYAFVPDRGALTRGTPTAHAALPLRNELAQSSDPSPVWPDPEGEVRGLAFPPPCTRRLPGRHARIRNSTSFWPSRTPCAGAVPANGPWPCDASRSGCRRPMRTTEPNLILLTRAVAQLGPLVDRVVILRGRATALLLTDPAAPEVRPTQDVDVSSPRSGR